MYIKISYVVPHNSIGRRVQRSLSQEDKPTSTQMPTLAHLEKSTMMPHVKFAKAHVSLKYGQMAANVPSFIRNPRGIVPSCEKPSRS